MSFDHAEWARRAVAFVSSLPDRIGEPVDVSLRIEPPHAIDPDFVEDDLEIGDAMILEDKKLAAVLGPLPEQLRTLYVHGATRLVCLYSLPSTKLWGGPRWIAPEDVADAARELRDRVGDGDGWDANDASLVRGAVPFMALNNGDFVALGTASDGFPVAYISHEMESFLLAPSLDEFLTEWERCAYIGPEWWALTPFRNAAGFLDGDLPAARDLRIRLGVAETAR